MTYVTKAGELWDYIAFKTLGSSNYTEALINSNREHIETFIFSAGVELVIPDIEQEQKVATRPPWKRT